jgi:hypothetical protein
VISNTVFDVTVVTAVTVAVVPLTVKFAAFTFWTFSSKVTRQIKMSALVGEVAGVWRTIDAILGAVVSTVPVKTSPVSFPPVAVYTLPVRESVAVYAINAPPAPLGEIKVSAHVPPFGRATVA